MIGWASILIDSYGGHLKGLDARTRNNSRAPKLEEKHRMASSVLSPLWGPQP